MGVCEVRGWGRQVSGGGAGTGGLVGSSPSSGILCPVSHR